MNYNPNNPSTQNARILSWLQTGHTITSKLAYEKFDCLRLSGRIWDLRNNGHDIRKRTKCVGPNKKYVAEYYMENTLTACPNGTE